MDIINIVKGCSLGPFDPLNELNKMIEHAEAKLSELKALRDDMTKKRKEHDRTN